MDLVFVDPPFNLDKDYQVLGFRDRTLNEEEYRGWCRTWLIELIKILKPGGALFLYHWPKWLMDLGAWMNSLPTLEYKGWIAVKMKAGFPIKGRVHPAHYGLLYYTKKGGETTFNVVRSKSPTCRKCGELLRDYGGYKKTYERYIDSEGSLWVQVSDFWEDTRPARQEKSRESRINELPLQIPERAILMASNPGDVVLDCFAGGGSTLHAAHVSGRYWIGAELGIPTGALRRLGTFIGQDEETPCRKIRDCFTERFRKEVLQVKLTRNRPVRKVELLSRSDPEGKHSHRSRVFTENVGSAKKSLKSRRKPGNRGDSVKGTVALPGKAGTRGAKPRAFRR